LKNSEDYILSNMKLIKRNGIIDSISSTNINITDEEGNDININVSNRNIPVLRRGNLVGKSALKVKDGIEYYVDLNKQVKFLRVVDEGIEGSNDNSAAIVNTKSKQGIVVSNSPAFEQITILNKDGIEIVYSYDTYTSFYKDNVKAMSGDILPGDTAYVELDEIENIISIRAISNYTISYGTIIKISGTAVTVKSEENGETRTYNLMNVPVYKEGVQTSYTTLLNGEYAKIYTSDAGIAKVEIVDDERTLEGVYKGVISDINLIYDTITLKDTQTYKDGKWTVSANSFVTIPLDKNVDVTFYDSKIDISELGQKQLGKFAYIAAREDSKLLNKARKISIDNYSSEKSFEGNVNSYNEYDNYFMLSKKGNNIYTDESTIFIENEKIIDIPYIDRNNKLFVTAHKQDGEYVADVVTIMPYEEERDITIYSGILYDLEENSRVTLRLFSELCNGEYDKINKRYSTFNITSNTRIFTESGPINIREFSFDNKSFDFEGCLTYLIAEGTEIIALTTVDMEDEPAILKGIISNKDVDTITLKSVEIYNYDEEEWEYDSKQDINVVANTLILQNGKMVRNTDIEEGQEVLVLKNNKNDVQNAGIIIID